MQQIDTRHSEMNKLFALLVAKSTGDIDLPIMQTIASMEQDDVETVKRRFEEWENINNAKKV